MDVSKINTFISHSLGFVQKPIYFLLVWIQEEVEIELGVDSKCAPKEEDEKLKVKSTSQVVREGLVDLS